MVKGRSLRAFFSGLGLWLAWMGTLSIIWISQGLYLGLMALSARMGGNSEQFSQSVSLTRSADVFAFFVFIISMAGLFQWLMLLKKIKRAAFWILATGGGSLMGMLIGSFIPYLGDSPAITNFQIQVAITGVIMSVAQWFVIRQSVQHSYFWIIAGVIGWVLIGYGYGFSNDIIATITGVLVICTGAVLLFSRSPQRQFNALVIGGLATVILIAGGVSSILINGPRYQLQKKLSLSPTQNFYQFVDCVAVSPNNQLVAAQASGQDEMVNTIKVWALSSGNELLEINVKSASESIAFSQDSKMIAALDDRRTIKLWDVKSGNELQTVSISNGHPDFLAFSPKEQILAIGDGSIDGYLDFWDIDAGKVLHPWGGKFTGQINSISFNPEGELLVARNGIVEWWDVSTGTIIREMQKNRYPGVVQVTAISPDGKYLIEVGMSEIKSNQWTAYIWDLNDGKVEQEFPTNDARSVAFSPDGNTLALGGTPLSGNLLWDRVANRKMAVFLSSGTVGVIAFSPDGKLVITGSWEGDITLWEVPEIKNK